MSRTVTFTVPGQPMPQPRHRMTRSGVAYTPKEARYAQQAVRDAFLAVASPWRPHTGAVTLRLDVLIPARRIPKWKQEAKCPIYAFGRSDWDNFGKLVSDALNKVAYADDRQITDARVRKTGTEGTPGIVVHLTFLPPEPKTLKEWNERQAAATATAASGADC